MKSNEYEFRLPNSMFAAATVSIRRILACLLYVYFLFRESLMSSFWKWCSRVKTLIRLARLKGVAGP